MGAIIRWRNDRIEIYWLYLFILFKNRFMLQVKLFLLNNFAYLVVIFFNLELTVLHLFVIYVDVDLRIFIAAKIFGAS
jgi:hypothetical protein